MSDYNPAKRHIDHISDEAFRLELATKMPAFGESFSEWAEENPHDEYALWMTVRYPEEQVEKQMLKRVRSAERAPKIVIAHSATALAIGATANGFMIEQAVQDPSVKNIGTAMAVGALMWAAAIAPGLDTLRERLPKAKAMARQERELFEGGMEARREAAKLNNLPPAN